MSQERLAEGKSNRIRNLNPILRTKSTSSFISCTECTDIITDWLTTRLGDRANLVIYTLNRFRVYLHLPRRGELIDQFNINLPRHAEKISWIEAIGMCLLHVPRSPRILISFHRKFVNHGINTTYTIFLAPKPQRSPTPTGPSFSRNGLPKL